MILRTCQFGSNKVLVRVSLQVANNLCKSNHPQERLLSVIMHNKDYG